MTINAFWRQGGTAITNFEESERPLYEAAIKAYGDPAFVISDTPVPPMTWGCSLHYLNMSEGRDLGDFWQVFHDLKKKGEEGEQTVSDAA